MKAGILMAALVCCYAGALQAGNYIISIDGRTAEIDLDKEMKFQAAGGKELTVLLKQKEFIEFRSQLFSMQHRNTLKANQNDLGDGIWQTVITTSRGTVVLVQEYTGMNPEGLIDLMLKELTKEEVDYGYKYREENVDKTVGGKKIRGKQAVTTYGDSEWTRSIYAYGGKDKGVLIALMIEKGQYETEQYVLSDFWESLKLDLDGSQP